MKPFSDWSECPKCFGGRFHASVTVTYDEKTDLIRRKCCNCGYTWNELPADRVAENEAHGGGAA